MTTRTRLLGASAALLVVGLMSWSTSASRAADEKATYTFPMPAGDLTKAIDVESKEIQTALGTTGKISKPNLNKARHTAIVLALYAEANLSGKDAAKMATLRDAALKVVDAIAEDKFDDARTAAKALSSSIKPDASASTKPVDLTKYVKDSTGANYDLMMQSFKSTRSGGMGYEKLIKDLAETKPTPKDFEKAAAAGYRAHVIAQLAEVVSFAPGNPKKKPEDWAKFSKAMKEAATSVTEAAAKKDAAGVQKAMAALDLSCANCHNMFK